MQRLGYSEYVAQGGDWGAIIAEVMAVQAPKGLLAIHTNMPGTVPPRVLELIRLRQPAPASFTEAEKTAFAGLEYFYRKGFGYAEMMNTRPQTLGYSLADSPVGMLAFYYDKFDRVDAHGPAAREGALARRHPRPRDACTGSRTPALPPRAPTGTRRRAAAVRSTPSTSPRCRSPSRSSRRDLSRAEELGRTGIQEADLLERGRQRRSLRRHEQPQLFAEEMRAAFRSLRQQ